MPAQRISEFDTWRPGYGAATVAIRIAGTSALANVFTDEGLSSAAANPQTLIEKTVDGVSYGKWSTSLYTASGYYLEIGSVDQTGVQRPALFDLDGEDASGAVVTPTGGSKELSLANHLARRIDVRDFGDFIAVGGAGASSATNTATLTAAIGAAGADGGGFVELPAGTYAFDTISIPTGVVLRGRGRNATILQSTQASNIVTPEGNRAGLSRLSLDGVSQIGGSTGFYSIAKGELVFDDVEIKRFETGLHVLGSESIVWNDLFVSDCVTGARLTGDTNSGGATAGKLLRQVNWLGGAADLCSSSGIVIENVDAEAKMVFLDHLRFDANTGAALRVIGARATILRNPSFTSNTIAISVADGDPVDDDNTVNGLLIDGGLIDGGEINLEGELANILFRRVELSNVAITLTTPQNNVVAQDCREDALVTIAGTATAWIRSSEQDSGAAFGVTTGNAATKAWGIALESGQRVYLEGKTLGRQRNGMRHGSWHLVAMAQRPPAELDYDTQTGNFTVGNVLTGQTSGATARIVDDTDGGTTGTLRLQDIIGDFIDNEIITDGSGGSATANGAISQGDVALIGPVNILRRTYPQANLAYDAQSANYVVGSIVTGATSKAAGTIAADTDGGTSGTLTLTDVTGEFVDNELLTGTGGGSATVNGVLTSTMWNATFVANGPEVELRVTGETGHTVEWTVDVDVRAT